MPTFKNVTRKMLDEYINALPAELKFAFLQDEGGQLMYEHEHLPITLRYHENIQEVYLEGYDVITYQYVRILEMKGRERDMAKG